MFAVMILDPPADPMAAYRLPFDRCSTMTGEILESGRFPGLMKLASVGMNPNELFLPGTLKSSISLFKMTPVSGTISRDPKIVLIVVVSDMLRPVSSAATMWDVPGVSMISRFLGS